MSPFSSRYSFRSGYEADRDTRLDFAWCVPSRLQPDIIALLTFVHKQFSLSIAVRSFTRCKVVNLN